MEAGFDLQAVPAVFLGGGARLFETQRKPPGPPVSAYYPARRMFKRCGI